MITHDDKIIIHNFDNRNLEKFIVQSERASAYGKSIIIKPSTLESTTELNDYVTNIFSIKSKPPINSNTLIIKEKTSGNKGGEIYYAKQELNIEKICDELLRTLKTDEYIEGEYSKTQLYLEKMFKENPVNTNMAFNKAWLSLYSSQNTSHLYTFISICSSLDSELLNLNADTLVLSCFSHKEPQIKEATIRAIEAWEQPRFIGYLEMMSDIEYVWLENYKREVMEFLRSL